jgi:hypothetical protein
MKSIVYISVACLVFAACNNSQREEQLKTLALKDSLLLEQSKQKDSSIVSYIHSLNDIQGNLEEIKAKEKILTTAKPGEGNSQSGTIVADIKALDELVVKNHREINALEAKLKTMDKQDVELKIMVANLNKEISDKDGEIVELESKLSNSNDSLRYVVHQFNDTMVVVNRQKMEINSMTTEMNSVYYAVGTYKELKTKGVLTKEGRIIGMGGTPELKKDFNSSYFTSASKPDLHTIPLYAKFSKLVTSHPSNSYRVTGDGKNDSFVITDPASFWSDSKYLVIIVTQQNSGKEGSNTASIASPAQ